MSLSRHRLIVFSKTFFVSFILEDPLSLQSKKIDFNVVLPLKKMKGLEF